MSATTQLWPELLCNGIIYANRKYHIETFHWFVPYILAQVDLYHIVLKYFPATFDGEYDKCVNSDEVKS